MTIKRFVASTSRETLNMVRNELGSDATIISNRMIDGMNEILAIAGEEMNEMIFNPNQAKTTTATNSNAPPQNITSSDRIAPQLKPQSSPSRMANLTSPAQSFEQSLQAKKTLKTKASHDIPGVSNLQIPSSAKSTTIQTSAVQDQMMKLFMSEIRQMRKAIESQLDDIAWNNTQVREPAKKELLDTLIAAGFDLQFAKNMAEMLPDETQSDEILSWAMNLISHNLKSVSIESEIIEQGGVFALIGPTGVGKTTTIAKMAARFVMKHGTEKLALITTDAYRIGGYEQLRIYGKILGVMIHVVRDEADLALALKELKNKHTILIDTVGLSQRDRRVKEQISMLFNSHQPIKKLLCLNSTNSFETLQEVAQIYRSQKLDGCVITKTDEAVSLGAVMSIVLQNRLKVFYMTCGQRVPEDIQLVNKARLMNQIFDQANKKQSIEDTDENELFNLVNNQNFAAFDYKIAQHV
ncbi:MAG: flagellar biosynthesis protein FlhF [Betaproteobacteria bacterium]|jgi:flagellar biosynthesis protein FlhF